jgi:hypothetical protein
VTDGARGPGAAGGGGDVRDAVLALDIGGTKLATALVDQARHHYPVGFQNLCHGL